MPPSRRHFLAAQVPPLRVASSVEIYSEFQRIDPFGRVVTPDRGPRPREILSPGVPRNAHASFHVAITAPPRASFFLYLVPNPADACGVRLFRQHFSPVDSSWIPDRLEEIHRLPEFNVMPDPDQKVRGQTTSLYLLDLSIPRATGLAGFRLEVQLKIGTWMIRPLEIRILPFAVPDAPPPSPGSIAPLAAASSATADLAVAEAVAGRTPGWDGSLSTVRDVIRRNIVQDLRLSPDSASVRKLHAALPADAGPEAYLRLRSDLQWLAASGSAALPARRARERA